MEDRNLLAAITVSNATDVVNPTADTSSVTALIASDGGDGISLREAITATNNTTGADTITFDGNVFTGGVNSLIRLTQGELEIAETLTIDASMATDVTITGDANGDDITVTSTFITDVEASFGGDLGNPDELLDDNSRVLNFSTLTGDLTLSNLTLTGGNTTGFAYRYNGGGIRFKSDGVLSLNTTIVSGSRAGSNGGGIYADSGTVFLTNSTVSENSSASDGGGGIYTRSGAISLSNSTIHGNSASGGGGAIFTGSGDVSLTNSTLSGNEATGDGGAIRTFTGKVNLIGSTVSGNSAVGTFIGGGGGIFADSGVVTLTNSMVSGNSTSSSFAHGGGICTDSGTVSLTNSTVSGNSTTGNFARGGGIHSSSGAVSLFNNSTVSENSSAFHGGGIYMSSGELSLNDSSVSDNITTGFSSRGGGISTEFGVISLANSTVSRNSSADDGGGIFTNFADVSLIDSTVSENSTTGSSAEGGGIHTNVGNVSLINSTITGNSTSGVRAEGGGIYTFRGNVSLVNSTVTGNSTGGDDADGGGIFTGIGSVSLSNSTVNGNSTTGSFSHGGGIRTRTGIVSFNSTVSGNSVSGTSSDGGGIWSDESTVLIVNSTVTGNSAASVGGGIKLFTTDSNDSSKLTIINSIIAGNAAIGTAPDIGGIFSGFENNLVVEHSLIGNTTGSLITESTGNRNVLDQPALLGPLADNGGPTLTHALLAGSPAIDAGSDTLAVDADGVALTSDQRGTGFDRSKSGRVDIGAFESDFDAPPIAPHVLSTAINEGGVLARPNLWNTLSVVFDADVTVSVGDLSLVNDSTGGVAVDLSGIGFSYDSSANAATWDFSSLSNPLEAAFYSYQLDAASITYEGLALDGNGDGTGGDDFEAQHYVAIPGDANLDGVVDVLNDAFTLVGNLSSTTNLTWSGGNFNGDGQVDVLGDAFLLVGNLNRDVRPPVAATSVSTASLAAETNQLRSTSNSIVVTLPLEPSNEADDQDETTNVANATTTSPQLATLVLAGDHELRDDVFGSDF